MLYRVPNNDVRKKIKTPADSPFNSPSLLKSPVVSVPSNGVTNNLNKEGRKKKRIQSSQIFVNLEWDYLTPQRVKLSYVKLSSSRFNL